MSANSELENIREENQALKKRIEELETILKNKNKSSLLQEGYKKNNLININDKLENNSRYSRIHDKVVDIIEGNPESGNVVQDALKELIHELDVYREEIEIQNEELVNTYAELMQAGRKYSEIFHTAPVGYIIVDNVGVITEVNKTAVAMFSSNRETLIGKNLAVYVKKSSRSIFLDFFKKLFYTKELGDCEVELRRENGETYYGEMQGLLVREDVNIRSNFRIILLDISDRKKAEKEAEIHSERLDLALWAAGLAWWDWHYPTGRVSSSQRKIELLGYSAEDFSEIDDTVDNWISKIHPDDYEEAMEKMRMHLKGETALYEIIYRLQTKEGSWKWMRDRGRVVEKDEYGKPLRISGAVQDIHESIKKEQERERLFNYSVDMFSVIDYKGFIHQMNQAWNSILGWSEIELLQKNILSLVHDDDKEKTINFLSALESGKTIRNFITRFKTKENDYRYLSWNSHPLTEEKKVFSVIRDITENFNQQQELEEYRQHLEVLVKERTKELNTANEKLHEANVSKDKFFSIISHDLKNPFQVLIGLGEVLIMNYDIFDDEKKKYYLNEIKKTSSKTYQLLENLLLWSRSQAGRLSVEPETLNLKDILNEALSLSQSSAEAKNIQLTKTISADYHVDADKNMLLTAFRNLLSNAIKFTPGGGEISVHVSEKNGSVITAISDTGIGIPQNDLAGLFKIDTNVSREGTNRESGTGLGLILCREFVEKNKGTIHVKSTENQGSTFYVTLPHQKKGE